VVFDLRHSFFLFDQTVIAVTDSVSVPPYTWQLRHPTWGQDMALKAERHIVAALLAKATTKLGLATTIAALWLIALPVASAVAQGAPGQISAARAAALQQCNRLAQRYPQHEWGNTQIHLYRTCMARHGQQE
jgi:hypothetical protein